MARGSSSDSALLSNPIAYPPSGPYARHWLSRSPSSQKHVQHAFREPPGELSDPDGQKREREPGSSDQSNPYLQIPTVTYTQPGLEADALAKAKASPEYQPYQIGSYALKFMQLLNPSGVQAGFNSPQAR